jgi:SAM-dependent methyltransferase
MDVASFRELLEPAGRTAVEQATAALDAGGDPLTVTTRIRRSFPDLPAPVAAAAITQAQLRRRARPKFGPDADRMWFTADGVEQATRVEVADHRAARFAALGASLGRPTRIADLCCGVGGDLLTLAAAGCDVTGYDRDELTVEVARANIVSLAPNRRGNRPPAVECLDVETLDALSRRGFDAAFLDPARRQQGRRTFDVRAYSPSWQYVVNLLASIPAAVKVAPGVPHDVIPVGVEAEWVSFGGDLKETVLWSGSLATTGVLRRATVLPAGDTLVGSAADDAPADVTPPQKYLYAPDPAVVRAHLVASVAQRVGGSLLDPTTAYVTSDSLVETPFARAFEIVGVMPFSLKRLRQELRERRVGAVTIMKRGSAVDVEQLRRDLRLSGDQHVVVVLALVEGSHQVLLAQPA